MLSSDEGHQSHDTRFFDGISQGSLMLGASAVAFGRIDLALGIHKAADEIGIFEINLVHLVLAKMAKLFFLLDFHKCIIYEITNLAKVRISTFV